MLFMLQINNNNYYLSDEKEKNRFDFVRFAHVIRQKLFVEISYKLNIAERSNRFRKINRNKRTFAAR